MTESIITKLIDSTEGVFALLFVCLLICVGAMIRWILYTNNEREQRYIDVMDKQAEALRCFEAMHHDVKDIKDILIGQRRE